MSSTSFSVIFIQADKKLHSVLIKYVLLRPGVTAPVAAYNFNLEKTLDAR